MTSKMSTTPLPNDKLQAVMTAPVDKFEAVDIPAVDKIEAVNKLSIGLSVDVSIIWKDLCLFIASRASWKEDEI